MALRKQKKKREPIYPRIRKGDLVAVIGGKEKGKQGKVMQVDSEQGTVLVQGLNYVKRHKRQTQQQRQQGAGGIMEMEAPIHLSNVLLVDPVSGQPTRLGRKKLETGEWVRVTKKSGAEV